MLSDPSVASLVERLANAAAEHGKRADLLDKIGPADKSLDRQAQSLMREAASRLAEGRRCANGHEWSNQFGDDWTPEDGARCDCGQVRWGDAIRKGVTIRRVSAAERPEQTWQPIETAPQRQKVFVSWINALGNRRTTLAAFYPAGTLELDEAPDDMMQEDGTNAEDGWFECREAGDAVDWHLNQPLDFWMPLPAPPAPDAQ